MAELAVIEQPQPRVDIGYWTDALVFAAQLAEKVHDTELVPKALRGRPEAVAAVVMYGFEIGIDAMQALGGIHIVEGRPMPSAELMRALILRAGHTITVHELSGTRCRVSGLRRGEPESERFVIEWTIDQARAAGLLNKPNWRNYPRSMLFARATGDLARAKFPDVIKGLGYAADDDIEVEWQAEPVELEAEPPAPKKRALQRRQRPLPRRTPVEVAADDSGDEAEPAAVRPDVGPGRGERPSSALDPFAQPVPRQPAPPYAGYAPDDTEMPDELQPHGTGRPVRPENVVQLPQLDPEPPPDEPPAVGPAMIGPGQLKALQASLTAELGTVCTSEERHAMLAAILGREVTSAKDLTRDEAFLALDVMGRFTDGTMRWQADLTTGAITLQANGSEAQQLLDRITGEAAPNAEPEP